ncbi:LysR substrate binding domain-containing protein [Faecalicatena orotica]|uniref:LysR substrate binding domain-containing protein n=1 Tax=Faecalicatena orotica TaxID=1544 RepID=A0A2Y9BMS8_9FIRM|nr:LysR substrate binding domain-containing protein [Faecalicatena orotica]SSA58306.1 LysR substrate binding domain-containing protein [Faecalicatena orotica]
MILRKRAEEILDLVAKTEKEITLTNDIILGDIYIGTGETDAVRILAKAAKSLQNTCPGIHYHISSGNSTFVKERLDKGRLDFGIVFGTVDLTKYNALKIPAKDIWGVLMRKDSPLAQNRTPPWQCLDSVCVLTRPSGYHLRNILYPPEPCGQCQTHRVHIGL